MERIASHLHFHFVRLLIFAAEYELLHLVELASHALEVGRV